MERVLNEDLIHGLGISDATIDTIARREQTEIARQERRFRGDRPPQDLRGRIVILIDDGLATGATMRAALATLARKEPARLVVAVPVAAAETCAALADEADEVICVETPEPFHAVGLWYETFSQTADEEVRDLLERATGTASAA